MPTKPTAWLAWSSGKDAAWALHIARQAGFVEIVGLMTTLTQPYRRVSMHSSREELLMAQALAIGLPVRRVEIPSPCSDEAYAAIMRQALEPAQADGITHMVFGDLFLQWIRDYRTEQLAQVGMTVVLPLWHRDTAQLAREMIDGGLTAHITCVDPKKLSPDFAGRAFDNAFLDDLPAGVDPCGENGEFHTFVTNTPDFNAPIEVTVGEIVERDGFVFADVVPAQSRT